MEIDISGLIFGKWSVISKAHNKNNRTYWLCRCQCGSERSVIGKDLKNGKSKSCGCTSIEKMVIRSTIHGHAKRSGHNITYKTWSSMIERCTNPNSAVWEHYGGRGIKVDSNWYSYSNFLNDMGERPSLKYSIDRIDFNGNYEKDNCRWETDFVQRINSRSGAPNKSGVVGVSWTKQTNRWHAYIGLNKKNINLGYFKQFEDAVKARKDGELKYWGESS